MPENCFLIDWFLKKESDSGTSDHPVQEKGLLLHTQPRSIPGLFSLRLHHRIPQKGNSVRKGEYPLKKKKKGNIVP